MKVVNLLEFLNKAKDLYTLNYAMCDNELVNFLDLMVEDEQFTQKIDLGIMFVNQKSLDQFVIVDGLNRILSLSLLLHAVCECYKKTTAQNDKAIKTIRKKYLLGKNTSKLRLNEKDAIIYNKIINGERLSGHEKKSKIFILLHNFWSQIKEENLQAASIFSMLKKIFVTVVETEGVSKRNIYYKLNEKYYGKSCVVDEQIGLEWARIPHFYSNFYVYKYATGFSAASALSKQILEEGETAVARYKEFLKSGGSDYPLNQLRAAGVDMEKKESVDEALSVFADLVDELEKEL